MDIVQLLKDKAIKPKEKTEMISAALLSGSIGVAALVDVAAQGKDPVKATCIEAMEFATKQQPDIADESVLKFVTASLSDKAPRVKWESAKVIGNIAHLFAAKKLNDAIAGLLSNAAHDGTVVRWSAAYALGEIIKLNTHKELAAAAEAICEREEKNSIKKIYLAALKKAKK